jgi:hypothetical protein
MGHTTPNNLRISIRMYVLIKVAMSVRFPGLATAAVMCCGVVHADGDDLLQ